MIKKINYNPIRNKKGVALIMATSAITLMAWLSTEITYDSSVEYTVNSQNLNRIKAYYAAKSAVNLGLLRVKIYQQVAGSPVGPQLSQFIDEIWKFKLIWPIPITEEAHLIDRDNFDKVKKESLFDANWDLDITDEGSKIDLADLVSPVKSVSTATREQLLTIFKNKIEEDYDFLTRNKMQTTEIIVDLLTDWQSDQSASVSGGNKAAKFTSLGENYPPNRSFRTLEEIRLIPGMTNEIFELLKPNITIYGMKALNPNTSDIKTLKSLDPGLTNEDMKHIEEFRNDETQTGFKGDAAACAKAFWDFMVSKGARLTIQNNTTPMNCETLSNFRIKAIGSFGQGKNAIRKEIEVITMDLSNSAAQVKNSLDAQKAQQQPGGGSGGNNPNGQGGRSGAGNQNQKQQQQQQKAKADPPGKGPPRIVYWQEK